MAFTQFFTAVRRALRWHRRWFAALFALIAVAATLSSLGSAAIGTVPTVVASRTIPGGTILSNADLEIVQLPASMVAVGAFHRFDDALGGETITEIPERSVLTAASLLTDRVAVSAGKVALPVRFADTASISLLSPGSRIDVLGANTQHGGFSVVAANARVVALPSQKSSGMLANNNAELVLIEISQAQATAISSAASSGTLSYALH